MKKVWLRSDENCRSSGLKFFLPLGPMLTKMIKKNCTKLKIENFGKKKKKHQQKIVWRYGGEGATHKFGLDPCSSF